MKPKASESGPSTQASPPTKPSKNAKALNPHAPVEPPARVEKRKLTEEDASSNKKPKLSELMKDQLSKTKKDKAKNQKNPKIVKINKNVKRMSKVNGDLLKIKKVSGRLGRKKTSAALENPYLGQTSAESRAVVPNEKMRPDRANLGAGFQQSVVFSANGEPELRELLSFGSMALSMGHARLLESTNRFTFAFPEQATAFKPPKPAESTLNGLDPARPPISTIDGIFDDMAINANKLGLEAALPPFGLRLATMCSGTEAPLLGMRLLKQALRRQDKSFLDVRHIFSAEIEPYKQAYIERNFSPPLLFRDVTDFRTNADAQTAYGGTAKQPLDVHILVAGSSCVDYSSLNQKRKDFAEEGQSFRTLTGIRSYVSRARPKIFILENVKNAPWLSIKSFFEEIGYACNHVIVDTKNYYLPQTRERGYMIALDTRYLTKDFRIEAALSEWSKLMWDFQRRANAPFSDFIYDNDDAELHAAKLDSDSNDTSTSSMGWDACRHRYAKLRVEKLYGSMRPMTHWQDNGSCKFPDFGWIKWAKCQRERIWDTLDIEYLRHAGERDYDMNYKIRWLELSQNVDRDRDTRRWGIVSCLTPSGIPYLTTRGGPVSGGESLLLQGIPKYALNLTKETSRQLQNLAGNAMSVPVVTSAILSGILAVSHGMKANGSCHSYFKDFPGQIKLKEGTSALAADASLVASSVEELLGDLGADSETRSIRLDSLASLDADSILRVASTTLQFCKCEGTFGTKQGSFQICTDCGHTTCKSCGQNPVHNYCDIAGSVTESRGLPAAFMAMITEALPTILQFDVMDGEDLASHLDPLEKHRSCKQEFRQAAKLAFNSTVYFKHVKRDHSWKISFDGPHSRLELRIYRKCQPSAISESDFFGREAVECHWLLFAKPPTTEATSPVHNGIPAQTDAGGTLREALHQPIARMIPQGSLLIGKWEIVCYSRVVLEIKAADDAAVPAWERSIGLQHDEFRHLDRAAAFEVDVNSKETKKAKEAARALIGRYELHPQCGTASASLHVRCETATHTDSPMFFFLEPEQLKNEIYDCFVFSTSNYRRGYREYRMIEAAVDERWRPYHLLPDPSKTTETRDSSALINPPKAKGKTRGTSSSATIQNWIGCSGLTLAVPAKMNHHILRMPPKFEVTLSNEKACSLASTFMLIELPIETYKGLDWKPGCQFSIDIAGKLAALDQFRWLIERAGGQVLTKMNGHQHVFIERFSSDSCSACAPKPPSTEYKPVMIPPKQMTKKAAEEESEKIAEQEPEDPAEKKFDTREKEIVKLMENTTEATKYEEALKGRPLPIVAIVHCHENFAILEIKLNIPTLCHRVMAKLCSSRDSVVQQPTINWSLTEDHSREVVPKFKVKPFLNNQQEGESGKPMHFKRDLWTEQGKALTWMMRQELKPCEWQEQEREEVSVPALGCRIDVEARVPKEVRGGILADEVGGGKTTTSLALVASMLEVANGRSMPDDPRSISVDTTLILVPSGLVPQWQEDIKECFDARSTIRWLVIKSVDDLLKFDVPSLQKQDIILASWGILDDVKYWTELEKLCGAQNMPTKAGRALQHWLREAMDDLGTLIEKSGGSTTHDVWRQKAQKKRNYESLEALNKRDPERRTAFVALFHALTFRRIIIDEYSYLQGNSFLAALELKATAMWLLSGTPPVSDYDAVNTTAKLLKTKITSEDEHDGCFSFVTAGPRLSTDKTDAEVFQWYSDARSPAWHRARDRLVDDFVEKFVRKNSSEAKKDIRRQAFYEVTPLSAHEQIVYFEVFHRLMSQNIKFRTKPRKTDLTGTSRSERLDMTVSVSEHPEDALLSCCSEVSTIYQSTDSKAAPDEMCTSVIEDHISAITKLITEIYGNLRECFAYESTTDADNEHVKKNLANNFHFLSFKLRIKRNDVGDKFVAELIDRIMTAAYNSQTMPTKPYRTRVQRKTAKKPACTRPAKGQPAVGTNPPSDETEDGDDGDEVNEDGEEDEENEDESEEESDEEESDEEESDEKESGEGEGNKKESGEVEVSEIEKFQASMAVWPEFVFETFPKEKRTKADQAKMRKQQSFRQKYFAVRNAQEKSRSEDMNMVTIEIVDQVRGLRLLRNVGRVLRGQQLPACSGCGVTDRDPMDLFILGKCGHIACRQCLRDVEGRKQNPDGCLEEYCNAPGMQHQLIEASRFDSGRMSQTSACGSKMDAVATKVTSIIESSSESIIIFVQFPRLLKALIETLEAKNVLYLNAAGSTTTTTDKTVDRFRLGKGKERVLILLIDSVNAAGWNLQRANHVMFVSAYFATTQSKYEATMTQAIGRAHRFGQEKTVHVYHFLMAKTLEVNIIQDREKKAIVQGADGAFQLAERTDSEPTTWEGPDMQGAASGVGALDRA